jgi:uncharacterized membrane protein
MRSLGQFIKDTFIGGLLVVLPFGILAIIVIETAKLLLPVVEPVVDELPKGILLPKASLAALLVLLFFCFILGLLARTRAGQGIGNFFERAFLHRVPGYGQLRSFTRRIGDLEEGETFAPALAEVEDALVPAFVVEGLADGYYTVFVPSAPTPGVGTIYLMAEDRVHLVDIPFLEAVRCISSWGVGSQKLLRAVRKP